MANGTGSPGNLETDLLSSLEAIVAPGAIFQRSGNVPNNSYLQVGTVVSSATGFPVRFLNASLTYISVTNELVNTFDINIIEWDGATETVLTTVSVVSAKGANYTPPSPISVTFGSELRCRVSGGSCKNPIVLAMFTGEVPA
jgi:hypothetical protein